MPGLRERKQKSGTVFYYFDAGGKPRKEIPLGSDYVVAVRKWTELTVAGQSAVPAVNFLQLADRYERDVIPLKAASTRATQMSDMKHLREFFGNPPAPLDAIRPLHIRQLLEWKKSQPTTANRLKRLFSHIFNMAREWDYTNAVNPVAGVRGFKLEKRTVYITDQVFAAVREAGCQALRDAMDLGYLTGQRPGDVLKMTDADIVDGHLCVDQNKVKVRRRIRVEGELAILLERIAARKAGHNIHCSHLAVNMHGKPLTKATLREMFEVARAAAQLTHPVLAKEIAAMWFYDLRAKSADDVAEVRGDQDAANLLGNDVRTARKHYIRRGKVVGPTR